MTVIVKDGRLQYFELLNCSEMKTIFRFFAVVLLLAGASCKKDKDNGNNISPRYIVSTLPGTFVAPRGVSVDAVGNVYLTDATNRIAKISANGSVNNSFSGNGNWAMVDGAAASASFWGPEGLATDAAGNVYVADAGNNSIRKILPDGSVTTLAGGGNGGAGYVDGNTSVARFNLPQGVAVDDANNIYVADSYNKKIRKITSAGEVSTLPPEETFSWNPYGIACDGAGNLFVSKYNLIIRISAAGQVSSFGPTDGNYYPTTLAVDKQGNVFYLDAVLNSIGKFSPSGARTIIAHWSFEGGFADGDADVARFNAPVGIAVDVHGNIYVADMGNDKIRKIALK